MSITHISTTQSDHGNSNDNWSISVPNVTAQSGDIIIIQTIARFSSTVMTAATWNGQSSADIGSASNVVGGMSMRYIVAASAGTYAVSGDLSIGTFVTATVSVYRPSGTVTIGGFTSAFKDDSNGAYVNPSLNIASVPSDSICVSFLSMAGWAINYDDTTGTTMSAGGGFTQRGNEDNTGYPAVTRSYVSTLESSGSVTASWTASAGSPMWVHAMFYLQNSGGAGAVTIGSTPANVKVTESRTIRFTNPTSTASTANVSIKINSSGNAAITPSSVTNVSGLTYDAVFTVPDAYALPYNATGYPIIVTTTDGSVTSSNVEFLPVTGNGYVVLTDVSDTDIAASPALEVDDQVEWTSAAVIDIDSEGKVTSDSEAATFSFRVWDHDDSTWGDWAEATWGSGGSESNQNGVIVLGIINDGVIL